MGSLIQGSEIRFEFFYLFGLDVGLAGTHESWGPQIKGLTGTAEANDDEAATAAARTPSGNGSNAGEADEEAQDGIEVCCFDNRGMGHSSVPSHKSDYTYVSSSSYFYSFFFFSKFLG